MGRTIDKAVIIIAAAFVLYSFFMNAAGSIPIAAALTFLSMCLLKKLTSFLTGREKRNRLSAARSAVEQFSLMPDTDALRILQTLPEISSSVPAVLLQRHPSRKTTADDIASVCRNHSRLPEITLVSLSPADPGARRLAAIAAHPKIRLIDGPAVVLLFKRHPEAIPNSAAVIKSQSDNRIRRILTAAENTSSGKCASTGAFMCLLFFTSGAGVYLLGGCMLLFIAAISLHSKRPFVQ